MVVAVVGVAVVTVVGVVVVAVVGVVGTVVVGVVVVAVVVAVVGVVVVGITVGTVVTVEAGVVGTAVTVVRTVEGLLRAADVDGAAVGVTIRERIVVLTATVCGAVEAGLEDVVVVVVVVVVVIFVVVVFFVVVFLVVVVVFFVVVVVFLVVVVVVVVLVVEVVVVVVVFEMDFVVVVIFFAIVVFVVVRGLNDTTATTPVPAMRALLVNVMVIVACDAVTGAGRTEPDVRASTGRVVSPSYTKKMSLAAVSKERKERTGTCPVGAETVHTHARLFAYLAVAVLVLRTEPEAVMADGEHPVGSAGFKAWRVSTVNVFLQNVCVCVCE